MSKHISDINLKDILKPLIHLIKTRTQTADDLEILDMMCETTSMPFLYDENGVICTDEMGNIILI